MKHINFTKPIRLIDPQIRKNLYYTKPPHKRILFTKTITWEKRRDSSTKENSKK